ncbi:PAS domain-containing hybrid sensor histidine kinase/response regulator [Candidatus Magnetaquicoccus inordinatus]|uniref:PAS domain-containing hybrid sensor histidine kinase/response regulator n=1 Tax=Candidatus Magnetaquicoccus inordinatus TaxID=2496818 RepID=UPI00102ACF0F|nr:PAS domain-containing hybrid sensor histidine kinase/response regulator [Candidatus Magnetaquicoccus inordinatus]
MTESAEGREMQEVQSGFRPNASHFRLMLDYTFDWEYWVGPNRQIWFTSPSCERITGYRAEEFLADADLLLRIVHLEDLARLQAHHERMEQESDEELDFRIVRRDGEIRWLAHGCRPVYREDGRFLGRRVSNRDITAKRHAEERLIEAYARLQQQEEHLRCAKESAEQATRAKSDFISMLSHEMRTPLNVVLGMTDLLLEGELSGQQQHLLQRIQSSGTLLLTLINQVLDLAKIEAGKIQLLEEPVELRSLLLEMVALLQGLAETKGVALSLRIRDDVPEWISLDRHRLQQIMLNLLGNSLKFTEQGEVVLLVDLLSGEGEWLQLTVRDSGIGIASEQLEHIFDSFSQADRRIQQRYGGSGLGLTICRRLLHLMGGEISVESCLGQGTTFFVKLPLRALSSPMSPSVPEHRAHPEVALQEQMLRILLAEDSEDNQLLIRLYLQQSGHILSVVGNGAEAVRLVQEGGVDLLLLDMQMPIMDGYSAARAIRQWEVATKRGSLPILALTAHAFSEEGERCLAAGCDDYLVKPLRKTVLLQRIHQLTLAEERALFSSSC